VSARNYIKEQWNRAIAEGRATRWSWVDEYGRTQFSFGAYDTPEIAAREVRNWPLKPGESIEIIYPSLAQLPNNASDVLA
jgi:hypothetical protein